MGDWVMEHGRITVTMRLTRARAALGDVMECKVGLENIHSVEVGWDLNYGEGTVNGHTLTRP